MVLSDAIIKEIAENLDCGLICFVHKKTGEVKSIIDPNDPHADPEFWEEDLAEIEAEMDLYYKIEKMPSRVAFSIMEDFTELVDNRNIHDRLIYALNRRRPFANFKNEVDYHEYTRQKWFKFKSYRYQEWVKEYLMDLIDTEQSNKKEISG